jgi:hypothetical protein
MQETFSHSSGAIAPISEEEEENYVLLGQYAANSGDFLRRFGATVGPIFRGQESWMIYS